MRDTGWIKSTRSTPASDNCVELRIADAVAWVRDSKNPAGGHLTLDRATLAAFVAGVSRS